MNLSAALQDSQGNLLLEPGKLKKINAAGSLIIYNKNGGREYFYIAGPTSESLRFLVRIKKIRRFLFLWEKGRSLSQPTSIIPFRITVTALIKVMTMDLEALSIK